MNDCKATYRNVHFRLDSGYKWGSGMPEEKLNDFRNEINKLFKDNGWEIEESSISFCCPYAVKGKSKIYLHPMDASGAVREDLISEVENILKDAKTFIHYKTDIYEVLADMSDEEYLAYLEGNKDLIINDLLKCFTTKRKNLFAAPHAIIESVKEKYRVPRITNYIGRSSSDLEWVFVQKVFDELVNIGELESAKTRYGTAYRTKAI